MPRKRKPKVEEGRPAPQANRVDLLTDAPDQPVRVPNNLPQGQRQQMEEAQRQVGLPDEEEMFRRIIDAATRIQAPAPGGLTRPTERSTEPITAGLSRGAGPGPEAFRRGRGRPTTADFFETLARSVNDPSIAALADRLRG